MRYLVGLGVWLLVVMSLVSILAGLGGTKGSEQNRGKHQT